MNMTLTDWAIVAGFIFLITIVAITTKKYTKSVSDFLAAGRCAGRYLLAVSVGVSAYGAAGMVGLFEMHYEAGFVARWWDIIGVPIGLFMVLSGWVIYRFRQTRALTLAQFFEMRYSKNFRVFAAIISFLSGILQFGIFPAVGARFFITFCGIPDSIIISGVPISMYPMVMAILLGISLFFTFVGGQIAVIATDFVQGLFSNIAFIVISFVAVSVFSWKQISEALLHAPQGSSMINPADTGNIPNFNIWFFIIGGFAYLYQQMAWQGNQGFNCSAKSPHEARMAGILGWYRTFPMTLFAIFLPICVFTLMHHTDFVSKAQQVNTALAAINNPQIQKQMTVPAGLSAILPGGFFGIVCAIMLSAFISNHTISLHSWGSIFIQDVILPFRKRTLSPQSHITVLRFSILGVAAFIFLFSLLFRQTSEIFLWFWITGTVYLGGAGAVIIGGLYWKKGTTAAAWSAMIVGTTLAIVGILIKQLSNGFPINEVWLSLIVMLTAITVYVLVSIFTSRQNFNLDKMLHRGIYADKNEETLERRSSSVILERVGITNEFTLGDKILYWITTGNGLVWVIIFALGTFWGIKYGISDHGWLTFWKSFLIYLAVGSLIVTVWFTIGGLKDLKNMFKTLGASKRDMSDDGTVNAPATELKNEIVEKASYVK